MKTRTLCLAAMAAVALTAVSAGSAYAYNVNRIWESTLTTNQGRSCLVSIAAGSGPTASPAPGLSTIGHFTWVYCDNTLPYPTSISVTTEAYDTALPVNDGVMHSATCPNTYSCIDFEQRYGIQGRKYKIRGTATGQLSPLGTERFASSTGGCLISADHLSFNCAPGFVGTVTGA